MSDRLLLSALSLALLSTACASTGGTEIHRGVTFYAAESAATHERWEEGFSDIPIYVITEGDAVTATRALRVRDGLMDNGPGRQQLFDLDRRHPVLGVSHQAQPQVFWHRTSRHPLRQLLPPA